MSTSSACATTGPNATWSLAFHDRPDEQVTANSSKRSRRAIGAYEYNSPGPPPFVCTGDCDGKGGVTVNDILTMVNIALGNIGMAECEAGDDNDDSQITIDEILGAVNAALNGCG
jgi:hypothetical protein